MLLVAQAVLLVEMQVAAKLYGASSYMVSATTLIHALSTQMVRSLQLPLQAGERQGQSTFSDIMQKGSDQESHAICTPKSEA